MRDVCTKLYLLLYRSVTADQNLVLKVMVLQHVGERRTACLHQGTGINTAPGALQACRQLTDALETPKSRTEGNAGYDVGKICRQQKPYSLQPRSRVKVKADCIAEKVPAATKEPRPGPDLHFAPGSFGELPGLVACHEISRERGERESRKGRRDTRETG